MDEQTFTRFPRLPLELRLMIWTHCSQFTRYVDLWPSEHGRLQDGTETRPNSILNFQFLRHVTSQPPPAVLYACKESRKVALQHYKLEFGSKHVLDHGMTITTPPRIYINWSSDFICPIDMTYTMSLSGTDNEWEREVFGHEETRRMAINVTDTGDFLLPSLATLDEIILYYAPSPPYSCLQTGYDMSFEDLEVQDNSLNDADACLTSTLDATVLYIEDICDDLVAMSKMRPQMNPGAMREADSEREMDLQTIKKVLEHIYRIGERPKAQFMLMCPKGGSGDLHYEI
ncbi:uncharacterized protein PAC_14709 [Phialocephala subalpina]|uniref:2EXR domain-containing protein n=1 Tax=Phialocephala subalpina TaxID=576137 RepID=A0A1L7XIE9_9HELO|nr:uncharacterized protein PAC_14709 [Phialocephala subalpina]